MRIAIIATPLHNMKYRDFINSRRKEWNSYPVGYLHYFIVIYLEMSKIHLDESGKRLLRDLKKLKTDPPSGIAAAPVNNDIYVRIDIYS